MTYQSIEDKRVYLTDEYEHELEVDLALMDDGIFVGVWLDGPYVGTEVDLTSSQVKEARKLGYESTQDDW
jgi:hypothetical protein|tara:strand:- start:1470 stop:1679 length:210 start_codon:yes stop_codon:yes gene_type:complete